MSKDRFDAIRKVFPFAFYDYEAEKQGDPWHPIGLLVKGYNENRHYSVAASVKKIMDECMSNWKPRTSALGGLPFLSFILRKPKPLGTEFKNSACCFSKIGLRVEVQRGEKPMQAAKYSKEHGVTAGCVLRLCEGTNYSGSGLKERKDAKNEGRKEHFEGDSWFASVRAAEQMALRGHEFGGPVSFKTI